jgi:signal peptidase II
VKKPLWVAVTVFLTVALDLCTKSLADARISQYDPIELTSFMDLVNVYNKGAAFGIFSSLGNEFFIGISIAAIIFIIYLLKVSREDFIGLSLILGGALGNLYDRITLGHVRDFLSVHAGDYYWPAFNVADSALTVGLIILVVTSIILERKRSKSISNSASN